MSAQASGVVEHAAETAFLDPAALGVEEWVVSAVLWLKLAVEATGALVIGIGVVVASVQFVHTVWTSGMRDYNPVRLTLARHLALALEFQLGADILGTAVAPSWDQIGKLAAIAVIRTALNYFLMREIAEEQRAEQDGITHRPSQPEERSP